MKQLLFTLAAVATFSLSHAQSKLDVASGEDLLKLLPNKLAGVDDKKGVDANKGKDKVKDAKGFIGVTVYRDYGDDEQGIRMEFINQSPSLISVNKFLETATLTKFLNNSITVVDGQPAIIQTIIRESGTTDYEILVPMSATLLSIKSKGYSQKELVVIANTIPVAQIAKKLSKN